MRDVDERTGFGRSFHHHRMVKKNDEMCTVDSDSMNDTHAVIYKDYFSFVFKISVFSAADSFTDIILVFLLLL